MRIKTLAYSTLFALVGLFGLNSCDDLLEFPPPDELVADSALQNFDSLTFFLNGIYDVAANSLDGRPQSYSELLGPNLSTPNSNDDLTEIYTRSSNFFNGTLDAWFADINRIVGRANTLIANRDVGEATEEQRVQLVAEARFLRAIANFTTVRLFAQPYGYTADNSHLGIALRKDATTDPIPRSTVAECYQFIIDDLQYGIDNLPEENGAYASKYAAMALIAKVYFQMQDYENAASMAGEVINSGKYQLGPLNRWQENLTEEVIFGFVSTGQIDNRTSDFRDRYFSDGQQPTLSTNADFYELVDDTLDRRSEFYSTLTEGSNPTLYLIEKWNSAYASNPYLNLTDMLLLRAEALAYTNSSLDEAVDHINEVRSRAYVDDRSLPSGAGAATIREAARLERQIEFLGTGDWTQQLKRRAAEGDEMEIRGAPWNCPGMVLQFPVSERSVNFEMNEEGGCN